MILHPVLLLVIVGAEAHIVVQRLAVNRQPLATRFLDGLDALLGADMHEIHRRPRPLRQADDAPEGDVLGHVIVHQVHVMPFGAVFLGELLIHMLDDVVVLGVDGHDAVMRRHLLHDRRQLPHPHHARLGAVLRTDVGGEDFEAGETGLNRRPDLGDGRCRDVREQHDVIGVIGVGLPLPAPMAFIQGLEDIVARTLNGEIDQRGGAAEQGGAGDLLRRGRFHAGETHDRGGDVGVRLDAPRNDDLACWPR